jgi:hypothetical protein
MEDPEMADETPEMTGETPGAGGASRAADGTPGAGGASGAAGGAPRGADEAPGARLLRRIRLLDEILDRFVSLHSGKEGLVQRSEAWRRGMATTVGGSEIAALRGCNPYKGFFDVVAEKVALLSGRDDWTGGGRACWWGTLFEDAVAAVVGEDLGSPVRGDEICVQARPGHRTSPDGFLVARFYRDAAGGRRLWRTHVRPSAACDARVALLEFKCPHSRAPTGAAPKQYVPQVESGLAVAPVASLGLFVDAVFRKCPLAALGDAPGYDEEYHRTDRGRFGPGLPVAWGAIFVYAPRLDAPRRVRLGWRAEAWAPGDPGEAGRDTDAAAAAWGLLAAAGGVYLPGAPDAGGDLVDLGAADEATFDRVLGLVDRRRFPVWRAPPRFADGRGGLSPAPGGPGGPPRLGPAELGALGDRAHAAALAAAAAAYDAPADFAGALAEARRRAPPHHWLLGVLPWKLLELDYVPVARDPAFFEHTGPLIARVHALAASAMASPDPAGFVAAAAEAEGGGRKRPAGGWGAPPDEEGAGAPPPPEELEALLAGFAAEAGVAAPPPRPA